jgi:hypothetical protein
MRTTGTVRESVGFGRLGATWNMIEELPKRFHDGPTAPPGR